MYAPGPGKAVYAWNAAMALTEHGFRTPRPLIGLRRAGRLGGAEGIAAFEDVEDHIALDAWLGDPRAASVERDEPARAPVQVPAQSLVHSLVHALGPP